MVLTVELSMPLLGVFRVLGSVKLDILNVFLLKIFTFLYAIVKLVMDNPSLLGMMSGVGIVC